MLRRKEADGLIFLGHRLPKEAAALVRAMAPRCAPVVNGCEFSPRLGIPSVHIDNAKAAVRGDGPSLSASATAASASSPGRWSARSAATACAARPRARRQQRAERDFIVDDTATSRSNPARSAAERLLGPSDAPTADLLLQRRDGDGR